MMSELTHRSVAEHAEALRKQEYSSVELTEAYLKAIREKDEKIGAFLTLTEGEALAAAKPSARPCSPYKAQSPGTGG